MTKDGKRGKTLKNEPTIFIFANFQTYQVFFKVAFLKANSERKCA